MQTIIDLQQTLVKLELEKDKITEEIANLLMKKKEIKQQIKEQSTPQLEKDLAYILVQQDIQYNNYFNILNQIDTTRKQYQAAIALLS